jgi:predicted TIM-barrel fold metal-dependent hydrolase
MIIDCHTHIWLSKGALGDASKFSCLGAHNVVGEVTLTEHLAAMSPADISIVHGFSSAFLNSDKSDDHIVEYVNRYRNKIIGFSPVDLASKDAVAIVNRIANDEILSGITISPACQNVHPTDTRAMAVYEAAADHGLPIYVLQGELLPSRAPLAYTQLQGFDEVARTFPDLKIVISHMGFPWRNIMVTLLAKHENIFTDVAGLARNGTVAYDTLYLALVYGVMDKILFASDFPNATVKESIESLYTLSQLAADRGLPTIQREKIRSIVERDALSLLGIKSIN